MKIVIALLIFNAVFLLLIVRRCYWAKPVAKEDGKEDWKKAFNPLRAIEKKCAGCGKTFWVTSDYKDDVCPACIKNNCGIGL